MAGIDQALDFLQKNSEELLSEWKELVSIPSVSTDREHSADVQRAAEWTRERLDAYGAAESRLLKTAGYPIVWAEFAAASETAATLLVYGHYDVQPVDPIDLWESDPFEPTERDGRLYGRGASDMKAQVMATMLAVRAASVGGAPPVNVRFLLEGEEEIGSPSLEAALTEYRDLFQADVCLNPDTGMTAKDLPSIRYGLRGLAYFQLNVRGPDRDLHSGSFGGVVHNPAQALAELIAGMHDAHGRVTIPGFYDRVRAIDDAEAERLGLVPVSEDELRSLTGAPALWGEPEYEAAARIGARPTLEINGIWGGYQGEGSKTVIPSRAHAKISTRLVPDQRYGEVRGQLEAYLREHAPETIRWELEEYAGGDPFICDPSSTAHSAFSTALEEVWSREPSLARIGGSVPIAADLERLLAIPSILTGFALPDDRIHSPNESQHIETWFRGVEAVTRFLFHYAKA